MPKRILFIPAGLAQVGTIKRAKELGYYTIAMDGDRAALGLKEAHESYVQDILSIKEIINIFNKSKADGIVSISCDTAMYSISQACNYLKIPGLKESNAITSQNKFEQRQFLQKEGLKVPYYEKISEKKQAIKFWEKHNLKRMIIKPIDSSGSKGVSLIFDKAPINISVKT